MKLRLLLLATCLLSLVIQAQTLQLQPLATFGTNGDGSVLPGQLPYLTDGSTNNGVRHELQRSMAYNPATGHLLILSRTNLTTTDAYYVGILDAATGADVGSLALGTSGTGGDNGFDFTSIAVGPDGAIYVCDLSTKTDSTGRFNLYHYASESATQDYVYSGNPSNGNQTSAGNNRWGDTMTVSGTGLATKILISSRGTVVAILTPSDADLSQPWSATTLQTDVPAGDLGYGLAFGSGNTFWAKAASGTALYLLSYNLGAGTATTLHKYGTTAFPSWTGPLDVQAASNLLAGLEMPPGGAANVRLYDISNTANPPALLDRKTWVTNEAGNGIFAGSVLFASNNVYALNSDNGLMAFQIVSGSTPSLPPLITLNPLNVAAPNQGSATFTSAADGIPAPAYRWYFNSNLIGGATSVSYTIPSIVPANFGLYFLVASNNFGMATSAVARLSEAIAFNNGVVYEPFNYSVGTELQGQGGWVTNTFSAFKSFIEPGNLAVPGLAAPAGNHYAWSNNITVRLPFGTITNGPIYFSFALQVSQIGSNLGEDSLAGLAYYSSTTLYPKIFATLIDQNTYQVGIGKGSGTGANTFTNATLFTTNDLVFVVARLVINTNTTSDDTCDLWVNPDPTTFGAAAPPVPNVANLNGKADQVVTGTISGVDRFSWRGIATGIKHSVDELRLGFTWASVTPPPPIPLAVALNAGNVVVSWPTNNSAGFDLIGTSDLAGGSWTTNTPVVVQGTNYTYTTSPLAACQFFRLKK